MALPMIYGPGSASVIASGKAMRKPTKKQAIGSLLFGIGLALVCEFAVPTEWRAPCQLFAQICGVR